MILIFVILLGLLIGSFLNVCIYRLPKEESIVTPPSHCGSCGHQLMAVDLIPVFSWLLLRGKCRYCGAKVSARYALVEILTGALFGAIAWWLGPTVELGFMLVFTSIFIVIFFIDLDHSIIPDELVIAGFITAGAYLAWGWYTGAFPFDPLDRGLGFLIGGGIYLFLAVVTKGGMGGGDIKLMAMLGLWLGTSGVLWVILLSSNIGAIASLILIALKIKGRRDYIPLGPFIVIGAMVAALFEENLTAWLFGFYG